MAHACTVQRDHRAPRDHSAVRPGLDERAIRRTPQTFITLIEQRRREPRDGLVTALATDPDSELDDDDIVALIVGLMFAGHETTTGLLGNTVMALSTFPDQRSLLRARPELIDNAIEEFLRYDPPAQIGVDPPR